MTTTEKKFRSAEAFHVGEYIADELKARNWTVSDLAVLMGADEGAPNERDIEINAIAVELAFVAAEEAVVGLYLSRRTAERLALAFGTSAEFWLQLDAAWHAWKAGL